MTHRKKPETGSLFSRLLLVALCAFPPQCQAFMVSPWVATHPFQEYNRLCSTFAFQDEVNLFILLPDVMPKGLKTQSLADPWF